MASFPGEIRLPRVARYPRLVLVNRPEPEMRPANGVRVWTCNEEMHVPEARVPNEGLCYVTIGYDRDGNRQIWAQCAFCGNLELV